MTDAPLESWAAVFDRLAQALGGQAGRVDGLFYAEAEQWFREAVEALYGVESLRDLDRATRQQAFQRAVHTIVVVQEHGDLALRFGVRELLRQCFAAKWDGVSLEGPPWRLDPAEADRPPYAEWQSADEFGPPPPSPEAEAVR